MERPAIRLLLSRSPDRLVQPPRPAHDIVRCDAAGCLQLLLKRHVPRPTPRAQLEGIESRLTRHIVSRRHESVEPQWLHGKA
eukprot:1679497-Prymnesium_polylepis.2